MNIDASRLIAAYEAELAAMTRRALAAEAALHQITDTPAGADDEEAR